MAPFAALLLLVTAGPGEIPKLGPGEIARLSEGGGQRGYAGRLVVMDDGAVEYGWSYRGRQPIYGRTRLDAGELTGLRRLIRRTNFAALRRGPRAKYPPRATDGIDRSIAVRQGQRLEGWSNTVWQGPRHEPPLIARLRKMMANLRGNVVATGEDALRLLGKPR